MPERRSIFLDFIVRMQDADEEFGKVGAAVEKARKEVEKLKFDDPLRGFSKVQKEARTTQESFEQNTRSVKDFVKELKRAGDEDFRVELDSDEIKEFRQELERVEGVFERLSSRKLDRLFINPEMRRAARDALGLIQDQRAEVEESIEREIKLGKDRVAAQADVERAVAALRDRASKERIRGFTEEAHAVARAQDALNAIPDVTKDTRGDTSASILGTVKAFDSLLKTFDKTSQSADDFGSRFQRLSGRLRQFVPLLRGVAVIFGAALAPALVSLGSSLVSAAIGFGGLATAAVAAAGPIFAVLAGIVSRVSAVNDVLTAKQSAKDADAAARAQGINAEAQATEALRSARAGMVNATEAVAEAERAYGEALFNAVKEMREAKDQLASATVEAYDAMADAADNAKDSVRELASAQLTLAESHLGVKEARLELEEFARSAGASEDTIRGFFQKFSDVYVNPKAVRKTLAAFTKDAGVSGENSLELEKLTLRLQRALLDEKDAANGVTDSHRNLAEARREEARFAREGLKAYAPYKDALERVSAAQDEYAEATKRANVEDIKRVGQASAVVAAARGVRDATEAQRAARARLDAQEKSTAATLKNGSAAQQAYIQKRKKLTAAERGFADALQETKDGLRQIVTQGTDPVMRAMTQFLTDIRGLGPLAGAAFKQIGDAIAQNIGDFGKFLSTDAFAGSFNTIVANATDLTKILGGPALRGATQLFVNIAEAFGPALTDLARDAANWLTKAANATKGLKQSDIQVYVDSFREWVHFIGQVVAGIDAILRIAAPFGDALVKELGAGIDQFTKFAKSKKGREEIKRFFEETEPFVKSLGRFLKRFVVLLLEAFQFLAPALTDMLEGLNLIADVLIFALRWLNKLPTSLKRLAGFVFVIFGAFRGGLLAVTVGFKGLSIVLGILLAAFQAIGFAARTGLQAVVDAFNWVIDKIKGIFGIASPSKVMADIGKDVIRGFVNGIKSLLSLPVEAVKWLAGRIVNGFTTLARRGFSLGRSIISFLRDGLIGGLGVLLRAGRTVVGYVRDGIVAAAGFIWNAARHLYNRVKAFFRDSWDGLKGIGGSIVDGLAQGIWDAAHWALDAIRSLAHSMIDIAERILGIHSPSKKFEGIGKNMVRGLAKGIEGNKQLARKQVDSLFADLAVGDQFSLGDAPGLKAPWVKQGWTKYGLDNDYVQSLLRSYARKGEKPPLALTKYGIAESIQGRGIELPGTTLKSILKGALIQEALSKAKDKLWPFAMGGIATGPTAGIFGEAGREAVLPLTRAVFRELAESINDAMATSSPSFKPIAYGGSNSALAGAAGTGRGINIESINLPPAPAAAVPDARHQAAQLARELRRRGG